MNSEIVRLRELNETFSIILKVLGLQNTVNIINSDNIEEVVVELQEIIKIALRSICNDTLSKL